MAQLALQNLDFDHCAKKVHLGAFQRQLRPCRVDGGTQQVARCAPVHSAGSQLLCASWGCTFVARRRRDSWVVDGPPGATGVLLGGVPPVKGVWGAAPGGPPQAPIFGAFLTDFHEVLLLFWDQLKPKNGYKYPATTAASRELLLCGRAQREGFQEHYSV